MNLTNLDVSKYKRFFAFGCSFTNYIWPTWADIIAQDIEVYQNWGQMGAGNHFIFNSVLECDARNKFTKNDLVIVMWSSIEREDRYSNGKWLTAITEEDKKRLYGRQWVKSYGDDYRSGLIRDMAFIKSTQTLLSAKNCDWANFSMYSICNMDERKLLQDGYTDEKDEDLLIQRYLKLNRDLCDGKEINEPYVCDSDVLAMYKDVYSQIKYSVLDIVRQGHFLKDNQANFGDGHPTPIEHLNYLNAVLPNNLSQQAKQFTIEWESVVQSIKEPNVIPRKFERPTFKRL
jgi:hypothetical protein